MVLPHDVWYHYYDTDCQFCDGKINPREYEGTTCEECSKEMCDECVEDKTGICHVCEEKEERGEDALDIFVCVECMQHCDKCNVVFHPDCAVDHIDMCNKRARAKRALASADKEIDDKERKLKILRKELKQAEERKAEAKQALSTLESDPE